MTTCLLHDSMRDSGGYLRGRFRQILSACFLLQDDRNAFPETDDASIHVARIDADSLAEKRHTQKQNSWKIALYPIF